MRELLSTDTTKGQVTIPVEVRRLLGVAPRDKVAFVVEDGHVRVARRTSIVERMAGALKSRVRSPTAEGLRGAAERAISDDVVERMDG